MAIIIGGLVGIAIAAGLILNAMKSNMTYFFSPSEVFAGHIPANKTIRLGGLVEEKSLQREDDGLTVHFRVTDNAKTISVVYTGILPDLFREGQGVIAQGKMSSDGVFLADEVLAKHDETYMPPEVAEALEKAKKAKAAEPMNTSPASNGI
jgi:cytochrome c-type biogenesis protein CcmE